MRFTFLFIILTNILLMSKFQSAAQTVTYYPAGNKAIEKLDSIVYFYNGRGECRKKIDLKNGIAYNYEGDINSPEPFVEYLFSRIEGYTYWRWQRYNELGLCSWHKERRFDEYNTPDNEGNVFYDKYGYPKRYGHTYDDRGNIIEANGKKIEYNERLYPVRETVYRLINDELALGSETLYTYDDELRLIEKCTYNHFEKRMAHYSAYVYDKSKSVRKPYRTFIYHGSSSQRVDLTEAIDIAPEKTMINKYSIGIGSESAIGFLRDDFKRLANGIFSGNYPGEQKKTLQICNEYRDQIRLNSETQIHFSFGEVRVRRFVYDEQDRLIEIIDETGIINSDDGSEVTNKYIYHYDDKII